MQSSFEALDDLEPISLKELDNRHSLKNFNTKQEYKNLLTVLSQQRQQQHRSPKMKKEARIGQATNTRTQVIPKMNTNTDSSLICTSRVDMKPHNQAYEHVRCSSTVSKPPISPSLAYFNNYTPRTFLRSPQEIYSSFQNKETNNPVIGMLVNIPITNLSEQPFKRKTIGPSRKRSAPLSDYEHACYKKTHEDRLFVHQFPGRGVPLYNYDERFHEEERMACFSADWKCSPKIPGTVTPSDEEIYIQNVFKTDKDQTLAPIHKACAHFADNSIFIAMMIRNDPSCASLPVELPEDSRLRKMRKIVVPIHEHGEERIETDYFVEAGQYPLHIAVSNNASIEVVKHLLAVAPDTILRSDSNGMIPLSLAIRFYRSAIDKENMRGILDLLLASYPQGSFVVDKRMNTPLHHACMVSSERPKKKRRMIDFSGKDDQPQSDKSISTSAHIPSSFLKRLATMNPRAMHQVNFNGLNPLELAQRSESHFVSDDVVTFLTNLAFRDVVVVEVPDVGSF
jgi:hypothetical protein